MFKDQDETSRVLLKNELLWSTRLLKIGALLLGLSFIAFSIEMILILLVIQEISIPYILTLFLQISTYLHLSLTTISIIILAIGINKLSNYLPMKNKGMLNAIIITIIILLSIEIIVNVLDDILIYLAIVNDTSVLTFGYLSAINIYITAIFITAIFLLLSLVFNSLRRDQSFNVKTLFSALILPLWIFISALSIILYALLEKEFLSLIFGISNILFGINGIITCVEFSINLLRLEKFS
ncbi:MAG TPA: hypothetical protein VMX55_06385 [candidate division Zixibacteria bacterium]|nr:hypothetical protein [candidate division Zixibacteria bacterium]